MRISSSPITRVRSATLSHLAFVAVTALSASASAQGRYQEFGDAKGFLNIVPPGQDGSLNAAEAVAAQAGTYPAFVTDQLTMYADLVRAVPGLTNDDLATYYKDASFGVKDDDILRTYSPTTGVTIVRDAGHGVPHIYGDTRYATMFAQGYATAEDRLFLMDVLRHLGRGRLSELLGASPDNLAMDRAQVAIAPYKETDLTAQLEALRDSGADGMQVYTDLQAYADGVNQYINEALLDVTKLPAEYPGLQDLPGAWKAEDAVAIASLIGAELGEGGGGELTNLCGLQKMATTLQSASKARAVFDDLHFADDPEAPTTSSHAAPYMANLGAVDPKATPEIDCSTLAYGSAAGGGILGLPLARLGGPVKMSNALLVAADKTALGRPLAVFGPQTGYFMPQLLVEKDVHGPDIDARGVGFAGTDAYVELGRGRSYAFSATSSSADNVDQFVLKLCDPGGGSATTTSTGYLHDGVCKPIEAFNQTMLTKPTAGGLPTIGESGAQCDNDIDDDGNGFVNDGCPSVGLLPELLTQCANATDDDGDGKINDGCPPLPAINLTVTFKIERAADYGPILARGKLTDGTPIAIANRRSTYMHELDSARGFLQLNDPARMASGYSSFREAVHSIDYTFNWFYIDDTHVGYQHSCKCPQRAQGVDPYLPNWGTGEWDWDGFIADDAQPHELDPSAGFMTSWNNKQAPGFRANDRQFSYGPVFRSVMLDAKIKDAIAAGPMDRAALVSAMELAGTTDLRGQEDLPLLLKVMGAAPPTGSDGRLADMRARLAAWAEAGAHRRDLDGDGQYDDAVAPAIMDAWWPRLVHAMFDDVSGSAVDALEIEIEDPNRRGHVGSAFDDGFYGHVKKDLTRVLGLPQAAPLSRGYCGAGALPACRAAVWGALTDAITDLSTEFGSGAVVDWRREIADEAIEHRALGLTSVPAIPWVNRPTFQQVVQIGDFKAHEGGGGAGGGEGGAGASGGSSTSSGHAASTGRGATSTGAGVGGRGEGGGASDAPSADDSGACACAVIGASSDDRGLGALSAAVAAIAAALSRRRRRVW